MKYNIGDKVRIKKDLVPNQRYDGILFTEDMTIYKGKVFTITNISTTFNLPAYKLGIGYFWTESMVEGIKEYNEEVK